MIGAAFEMALVIRSHRGQYDEMTLRMTPRASHKIRDESHVSVHDFANRKGSAFTGVVSKGFYDRGWYQRRLVPDNDCVFPKEEGPAMEEAP